MARMSKDTAIVSNMRLCHCATQVADDGEPLISISFQPLLTMTEENLVQSTTLMYEGTLSP